MTITVSFDAQTISFDAWQDVKATVHALRGERFAHSTTAPHKDPTGGRIVEDYGHADVPDEPTGPLPPYDARIHSDPPVLTNKGIWRRRRGVDDALFETVSAEIAVPTPLEARIADLPEAEGAELLHQVADGPDRALVTQTPLERFIAGPPVDITQQIADEVARDAFIGAIEVDGPIVAPPPYAAPEPSSGGPFQYDPAPDYVLKGPLPENDTARMMGENAPGFAPSVDTYAANDPELDAMRQAPVPDAPRTFADVMKRVVGLQVEKKLTTSDVLAICKDLDLENLRDLTARPDMISAFEAMLPR